MKRFLPLLLVPPLAAFLAAPACSNPPLPATCDDLAAPACPTDLDADVCADIECASVYSCNNGQWVFVQSCPDYSAEAGVHPVEAGDDAGYAFDGALDAPPGAFGGPGCVPLEDPDCELGTALECSPANGCCGCDELYVCDDGGWVPLGECVDGGVVPAKH